MSNIIFDFDGTLADSFETVTAVIQKLTRSSNSLGHAEVQALRSQSIGEISKKFGIHKWQIPIMMLRGRHMMSSRILDINIFPGMNNVLEELHEEGHLLFVVSSNSAHNVNKFLNSHKLDEKFVDIAGNVSLLGKKKAIRKLIKKNSLDNHETWYVGDETRDLDAAKAAGLRSIAVAWGFTEKDTLISDHPTDIAEKPEDIINILNDSSIIT